MSSYFVYLLECSDSSLYCGYTNDVEKRLKTHNDGQGAKYTKSRLPVKLVYMEECPTKSDALKRECAIKKLTKPQKLMLISEGKIKENV